LKEEIDLKRGLLMGEAMAKPFLTLLNLAVEELSFFDYCKEDIMTYAIDEPSPYRGWRAFHIGGDDHLAHGPKGYLSLITENHIKSGSIISPDKHAVSRLMVKYCERTIFIPYLENVVGNKLKELVWKNPELLPITDTVKVRLLEKGDSIQTQKDDKNVVFGKAHQLMRNLLYQDKKFSQIVVNLFDCRMGWLLPPKSTRHKLWCLSRLPPSCGGLDLGSKEDIYELVNKSPWVIRCFIAKAIAGGEDISTEKGLLLRLHTRNTFRGSKYAKQLVTYLRENIELDELPSLCERLSYWDVRKLYPDVSDERDRIEQASRDGIYDSKTYCETLARSAVFREALVGPHGKEIGTFSTVPYMERFRRIHSELSEAVSGFTPPEGGFTEENTPNLRKKMRFFSTVYFVKRNKSKITSRFLNFQSVEEMGPSLITGSNILDHIGLD